MAGEDDVVEARGIGVSADRFGAVGEGHRAQVGGMRAAAWEVDRDRRSGHEGTGGIPAPAVEAATVDEDDRDHGR